jgi:hypothetical protein
LKLICPQIAASLPLGQAQSAAPSGFAVAGSLRRSSHGRVLAHTPPATAVNSSSADSISMLVASARDVRATVATTAIQAIDKRISRPPRIAAEALRWPVCQTPIRQATMRAFVLARTGFIKSVPLCFSVPVHEKAFRMTGKRSEEPL